MELEQTEVIESEHENVEEENENLEAETAEEESEDGEDVITIDGETPPDEEIQDQKAPEWVRELRHDFKNVKRENKQLREELEKLQSGNAVNEVKPIKRPTLEEHDYDEESFNVALDEWLKHKDALEAQEKERLKAEESQKAEWENTVSSYNEKKKSLKVRDYDVAEELVSEKLSIEQQAIILKGADDPAKIVYAIGNHKGKLDELAKIKDPVKFAFAIAALEGKLKVERKSTPPSPEKTLKGSAKTSGSDSTLEKLREEAARTGDMTKVIAYKQQLKKGN